MALAESVSPPLRKPLRLWPGITAAVLGVLVMLLMPVLAPSRGMFSILSLAAAGLLVVVWWLFFSRAPWVERVGALALIAIAAVATKFFVHESLSVLFYIVGLPVLLFVLVAWATITRGFETKRRRAWLIPAIALGGLLLTARTVRRRLAERGDGLRMALDADGRGSAARRAEPSVAETSVAAPSVAEPAEPTEPADATDPSALRPAARTATRTRMARLPRPPSRRHRARRAHRNRLVERAARRALATPGRAGMVVVRGRRRQVLHAGAARRGRAGHLLRPRDRRADLDPSRHRAVLRGGRRRRPARDTRASRRPRLHRRRDRDRQRARRARRLGRVVAQRRGRRRQECPGLGNRRLAARRGRRPHRCGRGQTGLLRPRHR